jgi:hypothetical protein
MPSLAGDVMPAGQSGYTAALYALELNGTPVGFARSAEGGDVVGRVGASDQGTPPVARKTIQGVIFEPIVVEVGADARPELYAWISATLQNTQARRDGRVVLLDYQRREQSALAWTDGLLTEITFPELDASSRDPGLLRLTITADAITHSTGGGGSYSSALFSSAKSGWTANGFRLSISGMGNAPRYAGWIAPITVRQAYVAPPAPGGGGVTATVAGLDVGDLSVAVAQQHASELTDWHDDFVVQGMNAPSDERTATIEYLDATLTPVLAIDLTGIGIYRASAERQDGRIGAVARIRADMYCEELALRVPAAPAATTSSTSAGSGSGTATSPTDGTAAPATGSPGSAEDLVTALRAALLGGDVAARLTPVGVDASTVADRLVRSTDGLPDDAAATDMRVAEGRRLGADWARGRASLEELEDMGAVAGSEWNALALPASHSLVEVLHKHGVLPAGRVGDVMLPRDPFVEGIVEGAAEVLAEVRPLVRERLRHR